MADGLMIDEDLILPQQYNFSAIRALRVTSRKKIAQFLDLDGTLVVVNDLDLVNNFNGLAELIGLSYLEIRNIANKRSPTEELLELWTLKEECQNATIGNLWSYLYQMERFDVLKDCRRNILHDCSVYENNVVIEREAARYGLEPQLEQDPRVTNSDMVVDETKVATVDDAKTGKMTIYDAFVSYNIDDFEDRKFVRRLIHKLETEPKEEERLKLFVPGRDDLPGAAKYTINAYLIEKRCRRIMIVMSKAYHESEVCDFQTKFAQSLAPGARSKKLIPVIREKGISLPRILRFLAVCDFTKADMEDWVWDRLYSAIIAPMPRTDEPDYIDGESSTIDHLMDLRFPISQLHRLDDDDKEGIRMEHCNSETEGAISSASSSSTVTPMSVSQENVPLPSCASEQPDPKLKKAKSRFSIFKKKKSDKQDKIHKDDEKKEGARSLIVDQGVGYGNTRDQRSGIFRPPPSSAESENKLDGRVVLDIKRQSAEHKREPKENLDTAQRTESCSLKLESAPSSHNTVSGHTAEWNDEHLTRPNRQSSDCDEVTSTSSSQIFV